MNEEDLQKIVQLIAANQSRLYAYICTLLPDHNLANDVLQETNLVLWSKSDQYSEDMNFVAWAYKVAYYQVMAARRDLGRDRLFLNDELMHQLAVAARQEGDSTIDERQQALRNCMKKLPEAQRELILKRYQPKTTIASLAEILGRPVGSVYQSLYRVKEQLRKCVQQSLQPE